MKHFRVETNGDIAGPGSIRFPLALQDPPGFVRLSADLLDRLYELGVLEGRTSSESMADDRRRDRARGVMLDLAEDLGIDPETL
jgi:hypothetical protein